jgi:hypothetical protein
MIDAEKYFRPASPIGRAVPRFSDQPVSAIAPCTRSIIRRRTGDVPQNSSDCRTPATVQTNAPLSDSHHNLHRRLGVSLTCGGVATTTGGFHSDELCSRDEIRSTFDFHAAAGGAPYNAINGHKWPSD